MQIRGTRVLLLFLAAIALGAPAPSALLEPSDSPEINGQADHDAQPIVQRQVQPGFTRLPGGIGGRWAEYSCYTIGILGSSILVIDTFACTNKWSFTTGSQPIQIHTGSPLRRNDDNQIMLYHYTYENWGGLSSAWTEALCKEALTFIAIECGVPGYDMGGVLNIYTAPEQNTQTKGSKALSFRELHNLVADGAGGS